MVSVVIHSNPNLENQIESAEWLWRGFRAHGLHSIITADKYAEGDVHVVQGPHYAYREWLGKPNVLFLNRCFYGDARFDLSIGWLNPDGSRDFKNRNMTKAKNPPAMKPQKEYKGVCVVFGDYGADMSLEIKLAKELHQQVYFRPHPQGSQTPAVPVLMDGLADVWGLCDSAIGRSSTALVDAEINGLRVHSTDPLHVVHHEDREQWAKDISWAQWSHKEIMAGEFWKHLC